MDYKPLKISSVEFSTKSNRKPVSSSQAKQIPYITIITSQKELIEDLMLEQREQM